MKYRKETFVREVFNNLEVIHKLLQINIFYSIFKKNYNMMKASWIDFCLQLFGWSKRIINLRKHIVSFIILSFLFLFKTKKSYFPPKNVTILKLCKSKKISFFYINTKITNF